MQVFPYFWGTTLIPWNKSMSTSWELRTVKVVTGSILSLGAMYTWVVNLRLRRFTHEKITHRTYCVGGWVDVVERLHIFCLYRESNVYSSTVRTIETWREWDKLLNKLNIFPVVGLDLYPRHGQVSGWVCWNLGHLFLLEMPCTCALDFSPQTYILCIDGVNGLWF